MKYLIFLFIFAFIGNFLPAIAYEKEADGTARLTSLTPAIDYRVEKLELYLRSHKSPAVNAAGEFVRIADEFNLDWKFVAAIAGVESTFCKQTPYLSYNCWGWGIPTGLDDGIHFTSYSDGIYAVSKGLRNKYVNRGLLTIEDIGRVYAASPTWAARVRFFMKEIESFSNKATKHEIALSL